MKPWIMRPVVGWVPDRWALVKLDCGHVARFMGTSLPACMLCRSCRALADGTTITLHWPGVDLVETWDDNTGSPVRTLQPFDTVPPGWRMVLHPDPLTHDQRLCVVYVLPRDHKRAMRRLTRGRVTHSWGKSAFNWRLFSLLIPRAHVSLVAQWCLDEATAEQVAGCTWAGKPL